MRVLLADGRAAHGCPQPYDRRAPTAAALRVCRYFCADSAAEAVRSTAEPEITARERKQPGLGRATSVPASHAIMRLSGGDHPARPAAEFRAGRSMRSPRRAVIAGGYAWLRYYSAFGPASASRPVTVACSRLISPASGRGDLGLGEDAAAWPALAARLWAQLATGTRPGQETPPSPGLRSGQVRFILGRSLGP